MSAVHFSSRDRACEGSLPTRAPDVVSFRMPVSAELLALIRCPKCRGVLQLESNEAGLTCAACQLRYAVADGIPQLLIEDARPIGA